MAPDTICGMRQHFVKLFIIPLAQLPYHYKGKVHGDDTFIDKGHSACCGVHVNLYSPFIRLGHYKTWGIPFRHFCRGRI